MSDFYDHLIEEHFSDVDAVIVNNDPGQLDLRMKGYKLVSTEVCDGKRIRKYEKIDEV
jgi:hypothetical protein